MTTIKVFEIERYTEGYGENLENIVGEYHFFSDVEKAKKELKNIYNELYADDKKEGYEVPTFEGTTFTIRGYDFIEIYRIVEKEIKIF